MFEERKRIFQERLNFIHYFPIHLVIIHIRVQLFTVIARNFIHRYNSTNTTNFHIVFFRKRNKKKKGKKYCNPLYEQLSKFAFIYIRPNNFPKFKFIRKIERFEALNKWRRKYKRKQETFNLLFSRKTDTRNIRSNVGDAHTGTQYITIRILGRPIIISITLSPLHYPG